MWPLTANAALPLHPRFQTSYSLSAHFVSSPSVPSPLPHVSSCLSIPPASSSPLTPSGFFNGMLEVFESGVLNYYTVLFILFVSRNPTLTHLPLSGSLDFLLCDLIAPIPALVFFLSIPRTLAAALSFLSGRAYSLNSLPPFSLRLTPTLIMLGSTSH